MQENCDTNSDDNLSVEEIAAVTSIDVQSKGITDLTGVEYFTALTTLNCNSNQLTSLDVSGFTALTTLYCHSNQLTSLDVSGCTALTRLDCYNTQLTSLDVSGCTALTKLKCYYNQLTSLDVSGCTALSYLECNNNQLQSLDVSDCTALESLYCESNQLPSLDLSDCTALEDLYCYENPLLAVNASKQISDFKGNNLAAFTAESFSIFLADYDIREEMISGLTGGTIKNGFLLITADTATYTHDIDGENGTKTISCTISAPMVEINKTTFPDANFRSYVQEYCDTSGDGILNAEEIAEVTAINVNGMAITDLTGVEHFSALASLYCYNNQLTSLDVSQNKVLTTLWCYSNQLTSLDVSKNAALKYLYCYDNQLTSLDLSQNTLLTKLNCKDNPLIAVNAAGSISTLYVSPLLPFTEKTTVICLADYGINADMVSDLQGSTIENGYLLVTDCIATYTYDIDGDLGTNTISCTITADNHTYDENGFCSICGAYEPATDSDTDSVYEIGNAGQLYWLAQQVNSGNTGINAVLTADITVNTGDVANCGGVKAENWIDWTPIGNSSNKYTGTFDGQGYAVSGLYFNDSDTSYVGLFGSIKSGGKVSGVGIADAYFRGNDYVGGVCGANGGIITNCYNAGVVISVYRKASAGGICGYNEGAIINCYTQAISAQKEMHH
ncbi:leucine-rich repeat domain-containing protein [uncultured Ruminococcus sp.]|uniref:leucine-rich repeat domain-containing protein n=1 Tax=uncultured Ruminococcus sp. TaxID=165186 RepID=UPI00262F8DE2|nr:leucine-rich repeat domain-containing protein [uncultured Ruminococcus sp.]